MRKSIRTYLHTVKSCVLWCGPVLTSDSLRQWSRKYFLHSLGGLCPTLPHQLGVSTSFLGRIHLSSTPEFRRMCNTPERCHSKSLGSHIQGLLLYNSSHLDMAWDLQLRRLRGSADADASRIFTGLVCLGYPHTACTIPVRRVQVHRCNAQLDTHNERHW